MKKARLLREAALAELRQNVAANIELYRSGSFDYLTVDDSQFFEIDTEVASEKFAELKPPKDGQLFEVENCVAVYGALGSLTAYDARDERLWAYLAHTDMLEHGRRRWPIPADPTEAVEHVLTHFFARDKRQIERDNVASRLWWMAHLCERVSSLELDHALQAFLYRSDVRANIIERPTISQASPIFAAIVGRLWKSLNGDKKLFERQPFRRLMIEINSIGGFKLLDGLNEKDVEALVDRVIVEKLQLSI